MNAVSAIGTTLAVVALCGSIPAAAEIIDKQTVTTATYNGTVSDISPTSSTIVVKSDASWAPVTYRFNETTTWVDASGNVISSEQTRNSPVTVHYAKDGDSTVVTKVVASQPSVTKETTTTTTTTTTKP